MRAHTERSLEPKSGVKSDNISTWVFNMQISQPICKYMGKRGRIRMVNNMDL
jgi:hypothetical protein